MLRPLPFHVSSDPNRTVTLVLDARIQEEEHFHGPEGTAWLTEHPPQRLVVDMSQLRTIRSSVLAWLISLSVFVPEKPILLRGLTPLNRNMLAALRLGTIIQAEDENADHQPPARDEILLLNHELRTPLNAILGFAQLLEDTDLDERQREMVQEVLNGGRLLANKLAQVIDLHDANTLGLHYDDPTTVDLNEVIDGVLNRLAPEAQAKGLQVTVLHGNGPWVQARTDAKRLRQVVAILVENAVAYTSHGGLHLALSRATGPSGESRWQLSVADTGPGLPPALREHLGRPFLQTGPPLRRQSKGLGLGIHLALRITQDLGGMLTFTAGRDGTGTTALLEFPSGSGSAPAFRHRRLTRVLVLGDHPACDPLAADLSNLGTEVTRAVHLPPTGTWEVALTGHLPEADALAALRHRCPRWLLLQDRLAVSAHAAGSLDGHLPVPASFQDLIRILQSATTPVQTVQEDYRRVLLVEDDPVAVRLFRRQLWSFGINPITAHTGQEALTSCREALPDLVFLDLGLPDMHGLDVARQILALAETRGEASPVIVAVTASTDSATAAQCHGARIPLRLNKPVSREDLAPLFTTA